MGRQQVAAAREEGPEVLPADGLDHLDRDELVVAALELAVVAQQHGDAVLQAGGAHERDRVVVLLARDGGGRHAAAVVRGGVDGQPAPAGADLQQVVARAEVELAADQLELVQRRVLERRARRGEDRRRVHHPLVEEEREEVVAEVVVGGDLAAAAVDRVARAARAPARGRSAGAASAAGGRAPRRCARPGARARRGRGSTTGRPCAPRRGRGCRAAARGRTRGSGPRAPRCSGSTGSSAPKRTAGRSRSRSSSTPAAREAQEAVDDGAGQAVASPRRLARVAEVRRALELQPHRVGVDARHDRERRRRLAAQHAPQARRVERRALELAASRRSGPRRPCG